MDPIIASVAAGGALGAMLRLFLSRHNGRQFPWGTLLANIIGSGFIGYLASNPPSAPTMQVLLGVGFCGALTTFSTWILELTEQIRKKQYGKAVLYLLSTVALGIVAAWLGSLLGKMLQS